jgi:hypothetical protein
MGNVLGDLNCENHTSLVCNVRRVEVWAGCWLDSVRWGDDNGKWKHVGGDGGGKHEFVMEDGEYIVELFGRRGAVTDALGFCTNKGRRFGEHGGSGGHWFSDRAPAGQRLIGFEARACWAGPYHIVKDVRPLWG